MLFFRRLFDEDEDKENFDPSSSKPVESVATFHTPRLHGRNIQATQCILGGNYRVKVVTLFLTPLFRLTPNEAKGGRPY